MSDDVDEVFSVIELVVVFDIAIAFTLALAAVVGVNCVDEAQFPLLRTEAIRLSGHRAVALFGDNLRAVQGSRVSNVWQRKVTQK